CAKYNKHKSRLTKLSKAQPRAQNDWYCSPRRTETHTRFHPHQIESNRLKTPTPPLEQAPTRRPPLLQIKSSRTKHTHRRSSVPSPTNHSPPPPPPIVAMSGRPPHLPGPVTTTEGQNPLIPMFQLAPVVAAVPSPTNHSPPPPPGTIVATSERPPHLPRPVIATGGQNPLIPPFHPAPAAAAVPSPTNHSPPPLPPGTIVAMSERPPHLLRPVIATRGQNPLIPPFHPAPAPNLYGAAVIPPRPHAPPPSAASGDPTLQFRAPLPRPADALLHSVQNAQSSSFHPPQGYSAMPQHGTRAPSQPLQQNWRPQILREPQGGSIVPPCGAWASQPLPRKRRLEDGECSDSKRIKKVTMQVTFIPVLDFLDKYPPIEPYEFKVGSTVGSIPEPQTLETTKTGASVVDGYVELFEDTHAKNKSWGGDFDVTDMLVSEEPPFCVTIKEPKLEASISNSNKDLDQLVTVLLKPRYGENGKRPAYVDDFIARVKNIRKSKVSAAAKTYVDHQEPPSVG
uniref:Uncharacterized protein n=1 Tax=Setaria italica TaxID=4555 RepID=K4AJG6_SETIT